VNSTRVRKIAEVAYNRHFFAYVRTLLVNSTPVLKDDNMKIEPRITIRGSILAPLAESWDLRIPGQLPLRPSLYKVY